MEFRVGIVTKGNMLKMNIRRQTEACLRVLKAQSC